MHLSGSQERLESKLARGVVELFERDLLYVFAHLVRPSMDPPGSQLARMPSRAQEDKKSGAQSFSMGGSLRIGFITMVCKR